jgi:NAD+ diphosphatase
LYDISEWEDPHADKNSSIAFSDTSKNHHPKFPKNLLFCELRSIMSSLSIRDAEISVISKGITEWHKNNPFCSRCGSESEPILSGWERKCTSCQLKHFPRTDPVVIVLVVKNDKILLGRSAIWPKGMFSCLAGFMEPGESIEAAAAREIYEESGVKITNTKYLASQPWPFPASLMIACQAEAMNSTLKIDKTEIESAKWFSRKEVRDAIENVTSDWKPAREGSIARYMIDLWLENKDQTPA